MVRRGATTATRIASWCWRGPANDAVAIGFEAVDQRAFDAVAASLQAAGGVVEEVDGTERGARTLVRLSAPWGGDVEVALGLASGDACTTSLVPGGFLTEGVGFGHVVLVTADLEASHRLLVDGLGFGQSDWLETEIGPGATMEVRFYHCNRRHHTVALAGVPFEPRQRLHHLMVEVNDRDDVGAAFDRAWSAGLPIPSGLGRHDNDGMFSFYLQTPAGFQVEVGHGARVVTDGWEGNRRYDRVSAWGHQPLRPA